MTAQEARSFNHESESSFMQIAHKITSVCGCKAYDDVFTFNRWIAQGFSVRKGEKAHKLETFVPLTRVDESGERYTVVDDETGRPRLLPRTLCVFCRHQVEAQS